MPISTERTPLLRVRTTLRNQPNTIRYACVLLLGFALYCFYLILFLPRTSYQRDWNHLHGNRFTSQELEWQIVNQVSNDSIAEFSADYYLSGPHLPGQNVGLAQWTASKLEEFGFKVKYETVEATVPYPEDHSVRVLSNSRVLAELELEEQVLKEDPSTGQDQRVPTFHAYSNGNGTGQLIYANYGRKKDFAQLELANVDVSNKVALIRSGKIPLALKVKFAEQAGAIAALVYRDPADDGEFTVDNGYQAYPNGPARQPSSVERGSVLDFTVKPGHPSDRTVPRIPSIPISPTQAAHLLEYLDIDDSRNLDEWNRKVGPSDVLVEVYSSQNAKERVLTNVLGIIEGVVADDAVVIGNHRDSLVLGGADGNSGSAAIIELARVLGSLHKQGWQPYRSVIFASWDGGEYGMLGSTLWGQQHSRKLRHHATAYLNVGIAYSGPDFAAKASPLLNEVLHASSKRVASPKNTSESLYQYWEHGTHQHAHIGTLGSGSDFAVFFNRYGVPSTTIGFHNNENSPVYHSHSNYDSLHWQKTFGDTTFEYHSALAQYVGLVATKIAGTPILPFRVLPYAQIIERTILQLLGERDEDYVKDLLDVSAQLAVAANGYDRYLDALIAEYVQDYPWYQFWKKLRLGAQMRVANLKLFTIERLFLSKSGLPSRPWFRHIIFAPDSETGATRILPGVYESLTNNDITELKNQVSILTDALTQLKSIFI